HGRSGLAHLIRGSVAEEVGRHAPCPVLTIGPNALAAPRQASHTILRFPSAADKPNNFSTEG
ncbi:MAG: universal stress protein, partial [Candidatus Binataceae bacterium]